MIIVHGCIPIKPERRDEALGLARRMSELTQAEAGCISYDFYIGLGDPNTLLLFQEWKDMEALMGHFQTAHMEAFRRDLTAVVSGEIKMRRYAVQGMEVEEAGVEQRDTGDDPSPDTPRIVH